MRYLLLIHSNESRLAEMTPEEGGEMMAGYERFTIALEKAGVLQGSDRLQPTATATTVRVRNGQTLNTDGPFAETKEQLGGYYLIDVENLDEAIRWAAQIPSAKDGSVEVRPIWEPPYESGE